MRAFFFKIQFKLKRPIQLIVIVIGICQGIKRQWTLGENITCYWLSRTIRKLRLYTPHLLTFSQSVYCTKRLFVLRQRGTGDRGDDHCDWVRDMLQRVAGRRVDVVPAPRDLRGLLVRHLRMSAVQKDRHRLHKARVSARWIVLEAFGVRGGRQLLHKLAMPPLNRVVCPGQRAQMPESDGRGHDPLHRVR